MKQASCVAGTLFWRYIRDKPLLSILKLMVHNQPFLQLLHVFTNYNPSLFNGKQHQKHDIWCSSDQSSMALLWTDGWHEVWSCLSHILIGKNDQLVCMYWHLHDTNSYSSSQGNIQSDCNNRSCFFLLHMQCPLAVREYCHFTDRHREIGKLTSNLISGNAVESFPYLN